jgi:predicted neutral ceramidase superfamily lipid hydrolase
MKDPATYLASKYKYIFRVPGSRFSDGLVLATAGVSGLLAWQLTKGWPMTLLYTFIGIGLAPLLLNRISVRIFRGLPLHSTYRRLIQLTLLTNYLILSALVLVYAIQAVWNTVGLLETLLAALFAAIAYIRLTLTYVIDSWRAWSTTLWTIMEPLVTSLLLTLGLGLANIFLLPLAMALGTALGAMAIMVLSRRDRDGVSSLRLARGLSSLLLESDPAPLEETLEGLGQRTERVSEIFLLKGRRTGRLAALVVLPFHMGPFRKLGSSMLNWLIEAQARAKDIIAITLKGCSTHKSDLISSREALRVADEVVSVMNTDGDRWSSVASLYPRIGTDGAHALTIELAGRRIAIMSLHPRPMEDLPEEISQLADEHNISVVDPHHSFHHDYRVLGEAELSAIRQLVKDCAGMREEHRGRLRFSISRDGFGSPDYQRGIGPCGFSLLALEVDGKKVALALVDGNNALPHIRERLVKSLKDQGWDEAELLTTDTHAINGVILGGRGYVVVGEGIGEDELVDVFSRLSRRTLETMEEAESEYLRVSHRGARIYTEELLKSMAVRVRWHAALYLGLLLASGLTGAIVSIL